METGVTESESEGNVTKRLKELLKNQKDDPVPSQRSADAFRLKQKTGEVNKAMFNITLNDKSDFKNLFNWFKGKWEKDKKRKKEDLRRIYRIKVKGFNFVIEKLKQRICKISKEFMQNLGRSDVIMPEATNIGKTNFSNATKKH